MSTRRELAEVKRALKWSSSAARSPFGPDDTPDYIRARLAAAGMTKERFTSDAIAILHDFASGSLRAPQH